MTAVLTAIPLRSITPSASPATAHQTLITLRWTLLNNIRHNEAAPTQFSQYRPSSPVCFIYLFSSVSFDPVLCFLQPDFMCSEFYRRSQSISMSDGFLPNEIYGPQSQPISLFSDYTLCFLLSFYVKTMYRQFVNKHFIGHL